MLDRFHAAQSLHGGIQATFDRVRSCVHSLCLHALKVQHAGWYIPRSIVAAFTSRCVPCNQRIPRNSQPPLKPVVARGFNDRWIVRYQLPTVTHCFRRLI